VATHRRLCRNVPWLCLEDVLVGISEKEQSLPLFIAQAY
jgi:hypothetical protein